jgi:hypothetical protein
MEITIVKKLKLYPMGDIQIVYTNSQRVKKGRTKVCIWDIKTIDESVLPLDNETDIALTKVMCGVSDLLTDGSKFYTIVGDSINNSLIEIRHHIFTIKLSNHISLYGDDFESYFNTK